ncbi:MAG: ATP-binding protein [Verrucomicrobiota bacterium]
MIPKRARCRLRAAMEHDQCLALSVGDTGIGIGLSGHGWIFEEFTQVEGAHQAGKRGTGLGLPLSRRVAELLGGSLTAMSEVGIGSTFTLRRPVTRGLAKSSTSGLIDFDLGRSPVLVIEDNRETLLIYEKYLKGTLSRSFSPDAPAASFSPAGARSPWSSISF